jgi:hypothetical protein
VKPISTQVNPKLPFGKKMPVNWWTGKHVSLHKGEEGSGGEVEIEYSTTTHNLRYRNGPTGEWVIIEEAQPIIA